MQAVSRGLFTVTLHHVPSFGTVRVIYTEGVEKTWYHDGVREFSYDRVINDLNLVQIREVIYQ